jgi:CHAT domain-containing protein
MKYFITIFCLNILIMGTGMSQICNNCPGHKENDALLSVYPVLEKARLMSILGNDSGSLRMVKEAYQLQDDSFPCCLLSRYSILEQESLHAFLKGNFEALKIFNRRQLNVVDSANKRLAAGCSIYPREILALFQIETWQKEYLAEMQTFNISPLSRIERLVDSLMNVTNNSYTSVQDPYLLAKAYYYLTFQQFNKADQCVNSVLASPYLKQNGPILPVTVYNTKALIHYERGDWGKSLQWIDSGLNVLKGYSLPFSIKYNLEIPLQINRGNILVKTKHFKEADSLFEKILASLKPNKESFKSMDDSIDLVKAKLLHNYGSAKLFSENFAGAEKYLIEANSIYLKYLFFYFNGISNNDKSLLIQNNEDVFNALPILLDSFSIINGPQVIRRIYDEQLLLKNLLLKSQRLIKNELQEEKDSTTANQFAELSKISSVLSGIVPEQTNYSVNEVIKMLQRKQQLEEKLYLNSSIFRRNIQQLKVSSQDVQKALIPGETAIEFIQYKELDRGNLRLTEDKRFAAVIIKYNDPVVYFVKLCKESDLLRLFKKVGADGSNMARISLLCYQGIKSKSINSHFDDSLYNYLLAPLQTFFPPASQNKRLSTVYISPAGLLNSFPFAALSWKGRGPLIKFFNVRTLLTTGSLTERTRSDTASIRTAALWYDIAYGNALPGKQPVLNSWLDAISHTQIKWNMPSTAPIVNDVRAMLTRNGIRSQAFTGKGADEKKFKSLPDNKAHILHIETHGFSIVPPRASKEVSLNPGGSGSISYAMFYSGLLLANARSTWEGARIEKDREDGILTAAEVMNMNLSKTQLLVLGGCKTGIGPANGNEGYMSLYRAFKIAGVNKAIVSLWDIPDTQTKAMLHKFYRLWLKKKKSLQESFYEAQKDAWAKNVQPYLWAGFVLVE